MIAESMAIAAMAVPAKEAPEKHERVGQAESTSYCATGTMANGQYTHKRSVAMNSLPLGSKIKLIGKKFRGLKVFYVNDRIGSGSELDFWNPSCSHAVRWGRRPVKFKVLKYG